MSLSRYQKAFSCQEYPACYITRLQKGGYATDPNYAKKVLSIYKKL